MSDQKNLADLVRKNIESPNPDTIPELLFEVTKNFKLIEHDARIDESDGEYFSLIVKCIVDKNTYLVLRVVCILDDFKGMNIASPSEYAKKFDLDFFDSSQDNLTIILRMLLKKCFFRRIEVDEREDQILKILVGNVDPKYGNIHALLRVFKNDSK